MNHAINDEALDLVFRNARTFRKFRPEPITPQILMAVYDLMRLGPPLWELPAGYSLRFGELKELRCHDNANGMATQILCAGIAAAIAEETRHGLERTRLKGFIKNVY